MLDHGRGQEQKSVMSALSFCPALAVLQCGNHEHLVAFIMSNQKTEVG